MRSRIEFIADRITENLEESGTDVVLKWKEFGAGVIQNPLDQSKTGVATDKTCGIKAFLHFIRERADSKVVMFNEIQVGDVIMDYDPCVTLEGRDELRVVIAGNEYVAKPIGPLLKNAWDVIQGNVRLFKTVLLRLAT